VEWLEDRVLLSADTLATAAPLNFAVLPSGGTAQASGFLSSPRDVNLYRVHLRAGDEISAEVSAQGSGSGLVSLLRVFDAAGHQLALDDQEGGDPRLTFQAATAGDYFVGVSSAPNGNYDPNRADSGTTGGTAGLYTLHLGLTPLPPGAILQPDLAAASLRLGTAPVTWGESVPINFTVENRGGAESGPFRVYVYLANSNNLILL
jgi:hypothetical protein